MPVVPTQHLNRQIQDVLEEQLISMDMGRAHLSEILHRRQQFCGKGFAKSQELISSHDSGGSRDRQKDSRRSLGQGEPAVGDQIVRNDLQSTEKSLCFGFHQLGKVFSSRVAPQDLPGIEDGIQEVSPVLQGFPDYMESFELMAPLAAFHVERSDSLQVLSAQQRCADPFDFRHSGYDGRNPRNFQESPVRSRRPSGCSGLPSDGVESLSAPRMCCSIDP